MKTTPPSFLILAKIKNSFCQGIAFLVIRGQSCEPRSKVLTTNALKDTDIIFPVLTLFPPNLSITYWDSFVALLKPIIDLCLGKPYQRPVTPWQTWNQSLAFTISCVAAAGMLLKRSWIFAGLFWHHFKINFIMGRWTVVSTLCCKEHTLTKKILLIISSLS